MTESIDTIGRTAFGVAALRAAETRRPDALATDPYAADLLAAAGRAADGFADAAGFVAIMAEQVAVRTRFLDDALLAAGPRQVVLVASGMDTRPRRLAWPAGTRLFELDQPEVLAFKEAVLPAPRCELHTVGVDLREPWADVLRANGFRPGEPTAWLTEGLLYALDEPAADTLLATVTGLSAPGSTLAFDHQERSPALREALRAADPELDALWQTGPADPRAWLTRHGWTPHVVDLAEVAAAHGRTVHPAYDPARPGAAHSWLATATLG